MRLEIEYIRQFLRDSRGAISVDYVVLAGAVCVATIISSDIIKAGMRSLAGTVESELSGEAPGSANGLSYDTGFDNGSDGWAGAVATDIDGIGNVLGPIENTGGQNGVSRDFQIDPNATHATFSFDLLSMDGLDNDTATIFVGGRSIGTVKTDRGVPVFTAASDLAERKIIVKYNDIDTNIALGGDPSKNDARSRFEIAIKNDPNDPLGTVNVGFGSDATAGAHDEYFAVDNFRATGLAKTAQ